MKPLLCVLWLLSQTVTLVPQRGPYDCAVAALAMTLRRPYEDIDAARQALKIEVDGGLYQLDMVKIAAKLDVSLDVVAPDKFDWKKQAGLVVVLRWDRAVHAVYVQAAQVYDPMKSHAEPWLLAQSGWLSVRYALVVHR